MNRLRLVQVVVQPVFVLDTGAHLEAVQVAPITVGAADWPTFIAEVWPKIMAEAEAKLNGADDQGAAELAAGNGNRAARRSK